MSHKPVEKKNIVKTTNNYTEHPQYFESRIGVAKDVMPTDKINIKRGSVDNRQKKITTLKSIIEISTRVGEHENSKQNKK